MTQSKWPRHSQGTASEVTDDFDVLMNDGPSLKPCRIKNKILLYSYRSLPCLICNSIWGIVAHHVTTVGAGGQDTPENLMPLCQVHHREVHDKGRKSFFEKYRNAQEWAEHYNRTELLEDL